ncbi:hypothetical protein POX_a01069 [Penicillium oxalicum]|nr:hypothetical protein POX_a01069 [Penicillium oxalicum]KAI2794470.1 hypothetical protein POX_a01069 [Penicillium oxalicum]
MEGTDRSNSVSFPFFVDLSTDETGLLEPLQENLDLLVCCVVLEWKRSRD